MTTYVLVAMLLQHVMLPLQASIILKAVSYTRKSAACLFACV